MRQTVLIALMLFAPLVVRAQGEPRDTVLNVSISRNARVYADRVILYVGVEGTADTPQAAIDRVDAKVRIVSDTLRRLGKLLSSTRRFRMALASRITAGINRRRVLPSSRRVQPFAVLFPAW